MKLIDFSNKLKQISNQFSGNLIVKGRVDKQYLFIDSFCTYAIANRLFGYFLLSEKGEYRNIFKLNYEVQQQVFMYQYYPDLMLLSPQLTKLKRNDDTAIIKYQEMSYNQTKKIIILS